MTTKTVKQALEEGYEYYVYDSDGWQSLNYISDGEMDFDRSDIVLIKKESVSPAGMDSKQIAELIAEHLEVNHSDDTGDDTEQVYNAIKELDFSEVEKMIDEALSKIKYYTSSGIKLIP